MLYQLPCVFKVANVFQKVNFQRKIIALNEVNFYLKRKWFFMEYFIYVCTYNKCMDICNLTFIQQQHEKK